MACFAGVHNGKWKRARDRSRPLARWPVALLLAACALVAANVGARVLPSVSSRTTAQDVTRPSDLPPDAELEAQGALIGIIHVETRDVFDASAADEITSLTRLLNRLHARTRLATITDQLLFSTGDPYSARLLEESARNLRGTRYLRDAIVVPIAFHDGLVDVKVITQDVWTLNPGVAYGRKGGADSSGVEIEELNLLGTGMQIGVGTTSTVDRDSRFAFFRDRQIGSSWWDLSLAYADNSDGELSSFALDHPFYSLGTRAAGGAGAREDRRIVSRYDRGEVVDQFGAHERTATGYFGRSRGVVGSWSRRVTAGFTYDEHSFAPAPDTLPPRLLPADRKLVYPWIGVEWIEDAFHIARNRDQIEKTEDYSLGWRLNARLGYASGQFGSDRDAMLLKASISRGVAIDEQRTLQFDGGFDGRLESGSIANGLLAASLRYYSRRSARRLFFASLECSAGFNLDVDRQLLLGGDNGLRGYPLRYQSGDGFWRFTAEQRYFSNWYPFQLFNVGGAVFYDMGGTWGSDPLGTPSLGLLKDVGFGLRFGNARSALGSVLHVDVAFPLDGDGSIDDVQFLVETRSSF